MQIVLQVIRGRDAEPALDIAEEHISAFRRHWGWQKRKLTNKLIIQRLFICETPRQVSDISIVLCLPILLDCGGNVWKKSTNAAHDVHYGGYG